MNFLCNEFNTKLTFTPLLKTREQIQITAYFVIYRTIRLAMYIPFSSLAPYEAAAIQELTNVAQASAHRWALGFSSADDCLTSDCYASLEAEFLRMESPEFRVGRVKVLDIIPLSPRIEKPAPKEPRIEKVLKELREDAEDYEKIEDFKEQFFSQHVQFSQTKSGQRMQGKFDTKANDILLNRRSQ